MALGSSVTRIQKFGRNFPAAPTAMDAPHNTEALGKNLENIAEIQINMNAEKKKIKKRKRQTVAAAANKL